ncbi:MAG: hypothetical protein EOO65_03060, partial [Methanosarcinales archaeon]
MDYMHDGVDSYSSILVQALSFLSLPYVSNIFYMEPSDVWRQGLFSMRSLRVMFGSTFFHGPKLRLSYNLISLGWKGYNLERARGSAALAGAIAVLLIVSPFVEMVLSWLGTVFQGEQSNGFTRVLLGLSVLMHKDGQSVWLLLLETFLSLVITGTPVRSHVAGIITGFALRSYWSSHPLLEATTPAVAETAAPMSLPQVEHVVHQQQYGVKAATFADALARRQHDAQTSIAAAMELELLRAAEMHRFERYEPTTTAVHEFASTGARPRPSNIFGSAASGLHDHPEHG